MIISNNFPKRKRQTNINPFFTPEFTLTKEVIICIFMQGRREGLRSPSPRRIKLAHFKKRILYCYIFPFPIYYIYKMSKVTPYAW